MIRAKPITVLVVDDEPRIRRFVRRALEQEGWSALEAATGGEALELARETAPDCVLLDVILPDIEGFEVLQRLREFSAVPVLMLTGLGAEDDRVRGLDLGADDYIMKPFSVRELLARVRAHLRRSTGRERTPQSLTVGTLTIDLGMRQALVRGQAVALTPTEFALLAELAANQGNVLLPSDLLRAVCGPAYVDDVGLLRTAIWRLRRKLERDASAPEYVVTVPRVSYTSGDADADA